MRLKRTRLTLLLSLTLIGLTLFFLRSPRSLPLPAAVPGTSIFRSSPPVEFDPLPSTANAHPIYQLIRNAEGEFRELQARQSKTLNEAVAEYRKRYQMPPPPHFDKWFEFAKKKGVQMIDEYDTIYHSLLPFWALEPKTIRQRAKEAIGFDNAMIAMLIRDGRVAKIEGGGDGRQWQRDAMVGMTKEFIHLLPDMDLAFNSHDEPRVVIQAEDLSRLVAQAKDFHIPQAFSSKLPKQNGWSAKSADVTEGGRIEEFRTTRFNRFAHQATWTHSRASCPADSPSRSLDENTADNITSYAFTDVGFVYNMSAHSDICFSPSLQRTFGFFDRPNAFDVASDLFPIFSQSKMSSFQDILYPSPWYWAGQVTYNSWLDTTWDKKEEKMYWRGSTTGGFSRDGGWRRQHRQQFVQRINGPNQAKILQQSADGDWKTQEVNRQDFANLFDVKFTFIGQCDPGDCDMQKEFFEVVKPVSGQDAWNYKHLVDVDGNAFSGRYYSFLLSNSLVYKLALFREWHDEWLKPWVHFVPFSLRGEEHLEAVRYFSIEEEGRAHAQRLAAEGQDWARRALRNEDLEVWFFRLLLE